MGNVFGNRLATFDTDKPDARVEKIIKKLELSQKEFVVLFKLFGKYDKTGEVRSRIEVLKFATYMRSLISTLYFLSLRDM